MVRPAGVFHHEREMRITPMQRRDDRPPGDRCDVTLRDTFAAAALTGLLAKHPVYGSDHAPVRAYELADAMLNERANRPDSSFPYVQGPRSKASGVAHACSTAQQVTQSNASPEAGSDGSHAEGSRVRASATPTGNTQEPVAWAVEKKGYPPMFAVFNDWNFACRAAMEEYAEIVPLYRSPPPPLGDPEIAVEILKDRVAELESAIRRLADQDATLSVCNGNVTVTMDATLTAEEREALEWAIMGVPVRSRENEDLLATLRKLLERLR